MLKLFLVILVHIHMKLEDNDHVLILLQLIKLLLGLLIQLKNSIPMQQNDKIEKKMRDHVRLCFISISIRNKCCHIWPDLKKNHWFTFKSLHHWQFMLLCWIPESVPLWSLWIWCCSWWMFENKFVCLSCIATLPYCCSLFSFSFLFKMYLF